MGEDKENVKIHDTPAESSKILHADDNGIDRKQGWNFRAVVGCLNYVQAMIRPILLYLVHQCTRFCNSPKLSHEQALKRICRYLQGTRNKGLIFKPDLKQGFNCYVDVNWAGNWLKSNPISSAGVLSHSGFLIKYADCPILWGSKMQSLVALSTTEAQIHCHTFEDNAACIEVATSEAKIRPRTKHLAVRLFHFRDHIDKGHISIEHVSSRDQLAVIFTKPLPRDQFRRLRDEIMGWNNAPIAEYEGV